VYVHKRSGTVLLDAEDARDVIDGLAEWLAEQE
jgi:hypothetical protein